MNNIRSVINDKMRSLKEEWFGSVADDIVDEVSRLKFDKKGGVYPWKDKNKKEHWWSKPFDNGD